MAARQASEDAVAADRPADTAMLAAYMAYVELERVRIHTPCQDLRCCSVPHDLVPEFP